jgi:hypothetical protein
MEMVRRWSEAEKSQWMVGGVDFSGTVGGLARKLHLETPLPHYPKVASSPPPPTISASELKVAAKFLKRAVANIIANALARRGSGDFI